MLEENKKILEQNNLIIDKLEKKIKDIKEKIIKEEQDVCLYQLIIKRQKEKNRNKKCLIGATIGGVLFVITVIVFRQNYLPSLIANFKSFIAWVLTFLIGGIEFSCFYSSSRETKYSLETLINGETITQEEIQELLSKNNVYLAFMTYEKEKQIAIIKEQITSLEKQEMSLLEENSRIRRANKLEEQVLNDRLIERELNCAFDSFLEEKHNAEDVHFNNEIEKPLKFVFTNK